MSFLVVLVLAVFWQSSSGATWLTQYDAAFTFQCVDNYLLKSVDSVHSSRAEDRVFNFTCDVVPASVTLGDCEWS
ncbi:hypothetical protein RRG08_020627, partial [Elysia crispata]